MSLLQDCQILNVVIFVLSLMDEYVCALRIKSMEETLIDYQEHDIGCLVFKVWIFFKSCVYICKVSLKNWKVDHRPCTTEENKDDPIFYLSIFLITQLSVFW